MDFKVRLNKMKRKSKNRSIVRKFSNLVIFICSSMALLIASVSALASQRTALSSAALAVEETARVAAVAITNAITMRQQMVKDAGSDSYCNDPNVSDTDKVTFLEGRLNSQGFTSCGFANASGIDAATGNDIRSEKYFNVPAMSNDPYISPVYVDSGVTDISGAYLYISTPVFNDGKLLGVIYAKSDIMFLQGAMSNMCYESGDAYVLDSEGNIVAAVDEQRVVNRLGAKKQLEAGATAKSIKQLAVIEEKMMNGETGTEQYIPESATSLIDKASGMIQGYSPIDNTTGWSIAIAAPGSLFIGQMMMSVLMVWVVSAAIAVVMEFLVKGTTQKIVKPLILCADRMESLANGDLTTPPPVIRTNDETKRLADSMEMLVREYSEIIKDIVTVCGALAAKDLTVRPKAEYVGDFTSIEKSLNHIVDTLDMVMTQINIASHEVDMGSNGIAESAQVLAETSTEQSLLITELTGTMRNIFERAGENAESATNASTETKRAGRSVKGAASSMEGMMKAMKEINDKSTEINAIIKTIEDIAFQTNILALNASVEAARAGEAGQGFVVVADEVRQLAERSSAAAKDTTQLIEDTLDAVAKGDRIVKETAQAMESVFNNTRNIEKIAASISKSSEEQLTVVNGATQSVEQISDAVTQIAASSEESAATSRQLSDQSRRLEVLVTAFRLARTAMDLETEAKAAQVANESNIE